MRLVRYADHPELRAIRHEVLSLATFPEYMHHNVPGSRYWSRLYEDFPDFQLALVEDDELVADCGLAISVRPDRQSRGLSRRMVEEMRGAAAASGLRELIAPVRPTLKARYPLISIER